ncbi:sigma-70 family RNA polymerase sigma factor [Halomonas sp. ZH2S]|uniref:Sigma-70 family RNA polymerase sigma factor n=1 Tax=Vreelandella zhuhanensis TaxID=2684210 RepID=A0A7X3KP21_9GAMM|nr:sigma-70 family RNA polymerase sigma factor [Halomonas zhuhanensis]MWJ27044.1 sigma-70 family RNA polymerase sigma factor [Halomonas zhuhanensis]
MTAEPQRYPCIESAWQAHRDELRGFLIRHGGDHDVADDLLQIVYTKALAHRTRFCQLDSPRAWLFRVARHQWIDQQRRSGRWVAGDPPELPAATETHAPVDSLIVCIARALPHLSPEDSDILSRCDLEGLRQADYAEHHGLGLPATKARLRRARQRLRERLIEQCGIIFDEQGRICCHRADHG